MEIVLLLAELRGMIDKQINNNVPRACFQQHRHRALVGSRSVEALLSVAGYRRGLGSMTRLARARWEKVHPKICRYLFAQSPRDASPDVASAKSVLAMLVSDAKQTRNMASSDDHPKSLGCTNTSSPLSCAAYVAVKSVLCHLTVGFAESNIRLCPARSPQITRRPLL